MERIGWIDFLRGLAMILILAFHTEVYYKQEGVTPYYVYTTNAILLFYFLSGYLFYREGQPFDVSRKLHSVLRYLLVPYFLFTIPIAIAKALALGQGDDWQHIILHILSGRASWFIATLIVAELIFSWLLLRTKARKRWLSIISLLCIIIYFLIPFNQYNFWQWQDALLAVPFLFTGYLFHVYENTVRAHAKAVYIPILLLLLVFIKLYECYADLPIRNIAIENIPLFMADAILFILLIITTIEYVPHSRIIEWTGRHCIVYYFFCGGCPLLVSMFLQRMGMPFNGYLLRYILAFLLTYVLSSLLTWAVYRFLPFMTGIHGLR